MRPRACSHKLSIRIFEQIFGRFKAKIRRVVYNSYVPGVLQEFLTQKMSKIYQKGVCERLCEQALDEGEVFKVKNSVARRFAAAALSAVILAAAQSTAFAQERAPGTVGTVATVGVGEG